MSDSSPLLLPEYVLEGWAATLPAHFEAAEVIVLCCDHAIHEQFHSEFKTDMDLERLPSGKFDTSFLVCQLAAVAVTLLRLIGQNTLNKPDVQGGKSSVTALTSSTEEEQFH